MPLTPPHIIIVVQLNGFISSSLRQQRSLCKPPTFHLDRVQYCGDTRLRSLRVQNCVKNPLYLQAPPAVQGVPRKFVDPLLSIVPYSLRDHYLDIPNPNSKPVRARSARLRLFWRNAPDAVRVRTCFVGGWWWR